MRREDVVRLRHLGEAAAKAIALSKLVEIVGEAAKQISETKRTDYPEIPWSAAARMRDRLVHHSIDTDLDVLWSTITEDLPSLVTTLPDVEQPT